MSNNEVFKKAGSALHVGSSDQISDSDISQAIAKLLDNYFLRVEMSQKGRKIVDGKGIERVVSEIPHEVLS